MAEPAFETLLFDVSDGIATIRLNRPEKLNAYDGVMRLELIRAFDLTDADDAVRAVVVTGEGRAFCAGADLGQGAATFQVDRRPGGLAQAEVVDGLARDGGGQLALRIFDSLKPVIGAVNGPAAGVGATMLLPMDIRLASDTARFGFVFARRGVTPDGACSWFLPRLVGPSAALDWCLSGRLVGAAEAAAAGLVKAVVAPGALMDVAREAAAEIAANCAPVSVALTRRLIWRSLTFAHPMEAHRSESRAIRARASSQDPKEGVAAFREKRPPRFPERISEGLPEAFPDWIEPKFR